MKYNLLEKSVYLKSRYELIALLEDIQPMREELYSGAGLFNVVANNYEKYMDICFPQIPYSEERLALFSHIYNNAGVMDSNVRFALNSGCRTAIWFAMGYVRSDYHPHQHKKVKHCFYEAELFGLFDNFEAIESTEIEAIIARFNLPFKQAQTHWHYMYGHKHEHDDCPFLCVHTTLKPIIDYVKKNTENNKILFRMDEKTDCVVCMDSFFTPLLS